MLVDQEYEVVNQVPMTRWMGPSDCKLFLIQTLPEWKAFFQLLMKQPIVAVDTETTGFNWFSTDRIVGMSFGWGQDHNFYVPVRHESSVTGGPVLEQLSMEDILDDLKLFAARRNVWLILHNAKFDQHFFKKEGVVFQGKIHDTRIRWQFYDENAPGALKTISTGWRDLMGHWHPGLVSKDANDLEKRIDRWRADEAIARRKEYEKVVQLKMIEMGSDLDYQGWKLADIKRHAKHTLCKDHPYYEAKKDSVHYGCVPIDLMGQYAAVDVYLTWVIFFKTEEAVTASEAVAALYENELSLSEALFDMEEHGVKIRRQFLTELGQEFDAKILELETTLKGMLGDINLNSAQQLATALQGLGIELTKVTDSSTDDKRRYAVDKEVLEDLATEWEVADKLLQLRELLKLKSTYVNGILDKLGDDDILHCSFNQNVATGRMSSYDPNLQNIPGRTKYGKMIRKAFGVPSDEYVLVLIDYSQIEVRLTAHYSQDPLFLDAYAKGQDIHTRTMCEMWGYDYDTVQRALESEDENEPQLAEWKLLRNIAKRINFGIIYGVGPDGLSRQVPRPKEFVWTPDHAQSKEDLNKAWVAQCREYIAQYMYKYLGVKRFINRGARQVLRTGQAVNGYGRVRNLPWHNASKVLGEEFKWMEGRAARQGVNFEVQGEAADLFKIALVRVHKLLKGKKSKVVLPVHDELQFYIHKSELDLLPEIRRVMEDFPQYSIPILVSIDYSTVSWGDKTKLV